MALHNPPSLYTGGAERLNSQQGVNLYAQLLARKYAREQALDEYERNRINRMNEKGVRDIDREGLDKRVLGLKRTYQANKAAIRQGNTPEAYAYEKEFRDVSAYVSHSVDRTARSIALMKHREERLKMGRMLPDEAWDEYQAHELAIDAEGSASIDLTKYISRAAPKYDQKAALSLYSKIKRTPSISHEPIEGRPELLREVTTSTFDDDAKDAITAIAWDEYDNNDGFAAIVQESFNNPVKRGQLEKTFREQFKTEPQSLRDFAVANKIEQLQPTIQTEKNVPNWKYRADYMQMYKEKNIAANKTASPDEVYDIYQTVKNDIIKRQSQGEEWLEVIQLSNPNAVKNIVEQAQIKKKSLTPDKLRIIEGDDGSIRIFTKPDANGKTDFVGYVDKTAMNVPKQPTAKQKTAVIVEGNPPIKKSKPKDRLGIRD